jgi:hypothetical protein
VRTDTGSVRTAAGAPVPGRVVRVEPAAFLLGRRSSSSGGAWATTYVLWRTARVTASFTGDGVHDPSHSIPYTAYVAAFVSLDLPAAVTVHRGATVVLRGVVRPQASGTVQVQVREDRPGAPYRLLRDVRLERKPFDTAYRATWHPATTGRYVLRTRWRGGTTAPGGVTDGESAPRRVQVE